MWGRRAPTRCITVPQGARKGSNEGGRFKLNSGPKKQGRLIRPNKIDIAVRRASMRLSGEGRELVRDLDAGLSVCTDFCLAILRDDSGPGSPTSLQAR